MSLPDIQYAASLLESGDTSAARKLLQDLIVAVPHHVAARVLLARLAREQGRDQESLRLWQEAALLCPSSPVIRAGLRDAVLFRHFGGPDTGEPEFQDLNRLIEELESARIVPNPDIPAVSDEELETELDDVVTETLARIYENQQYYGEAVLVYEKLAEQYPDRQQEFLDRAAALRDRKG